MPDAFKSRRKIYHLDGHNLDRATRIVFAGPNPNPDGARSIPPTPAIQEILAPIPGPPQHGRVKHYLVAQLDEIQPQPCPCGTTRRGFAVPGNTTATIHRVDISADSRPHYHKSLTEIYLVLEGEGHVELDGERIPVRPMTAIMIKPGCRHRAIGNLRIANVCMPPFDPEDEWFD